MKKTIKNNKIKIFLIFIFTCSTMFAQSIHIIQTNGIFKK